MTMATDFTLAGLGLVWGVRLLRIAARGGARPVRYWGLAFLAMAAGAAAGGVSHGFVEHMGPAAQALCWKLTVFAIGFASCFLLIGSIGSTLGRAAARWWIGLAVVKLGVYLWWMSGHDAFRFVVYDYGPSMLAVLGLNLWLWRWRRKPSGGWIVLGVVVSLMGAAVQMSGFALHRHFNHNDLYHVIQMAGLACFYVGAKGLRGA